MLAALKWEFSWAFNDFNLFLGINPCRTSDKICCFFSECLPRCWYLSGMRCLVQNKPWRREWCSLPWILLSLQCIPDSLPLLLLWFLALGASLPLDLGLEWVCFLVISCFSVLSCIPKVCLFDTSVECQGRASPLPHCSGDGKVSKTTTNVGFGILALVFYGFVLHDRILNLCDSRLRLWSRLSTTAADLEGIFSFFSIMLVWKWYHLLWGNNRLGTGFGKCSIRARKQPSQQKPQEKSLHAVEMSSFSLTLAIPDKIGRRFFFSFFSTMPGHGGTCPVAHPLAMCLLPLAPFLQLFTTVLLFGSTAWLPQLGSSGRQLLSWATLTIKMVVQICESRII